jgi:iron complex outermembrane receptor protein
VKKFAATVVGLALCMPTAYGDDDLSEVVVTASPFAASIGDTAQPVTVIAGDALRRQNNVSLGQSLANTPGVSSTFYGPIADRPVLRGLSGYQVEILSDGLTAMDVANLSDDHAVAIDTADAEQIEVLRGPAALLYGSDAAGGVVNVVTERFRPRKTNDAWAGSLNLHGGDALSERSAAGRLSWSGAHGRVYAEGSSRKTSDMRAAEFRVANSASDSSAFGAGGNWQFADGQLGAAYSHFGTRYGLPTEAATFIDMQQQRVDLRYRSALHGAGFSGVEVQAAGSDYTHTEFEAPGQPGTRFDNQQLDARMAFLREPSDQGRTQLGVQLTRQDFVALGDEAFVPPSLTTTVGLFGVHEHDFGAWQAQAGLRIDNQRIAPDAVGASRYDDHAISASLGAVWRSGASQRVTASLSRTERHPQAAELYANGPHLALGRVEIGNADFAREIATALDLTFQQRGERWQTDVAVFFNRYRDFIFAEPDGTFVAGEDGEEPLPVYRYQQRDAEMFGAEVGAAFLLGRVRDARARLRVFGDWVRGRLTDGGNLPSMPAYRAGVALQLDADRWFTELRYTHTGAQPATAVNETATRGFDMLAVESSCRIAFARHTLSLFLRGDNLLDEDARLHASPLKDIVPLPGRNVRIGVRIEFGR